MQAKAWVQRVFFRFGRYSSLAPAPHDMSGGVELQGGVSRPTRNAPKLTLGGHGSVTNGGGGGESVTSYSRLGDGAGAEEGNGGNGAETVESVGVVGEAVSEDEDVMRERERVAGGGGGFALIIQNLRKVRVACP